MNSAKRYVFVALAVAFAVSTFSVIAPRTAHALVATLVQVANTSANAVPVVIGPGGMPYSESETIITAAGNDFGNGQTFTPSTTHTLVIDQISWIGLVSDQSIYEFVNCTTGGHPQTYYFQVPGLGQHMVIGTIPLRIYCDANTTVEVGAGNLTGQPTGASQTYVLSGYLLP